MSFKIISIPSFDKELKILSKKHRSVPKDYEKLLDDLEKTQK
jgi:mRNA-degrading endonuclease RelE of RelBE toxin-antitoxin system